MGLDAQRMFLDYPLLDSVRPFFSLDVKDILDQNLSVKYPHQKSFLQSCLGFFHLCIAVRKNSGKADFSQAPRDGSQLF